MPRGTPKKEQKQKHQIDYLNKKHTQFTSPTDINATFKWTKNCITKFESTKLHLHQNGNHVLLKLMVQGFPGGSLVKNPPAGTGEMGSIPSLGRSHMSQSN